MKRLQQKSLIFMFLVLALGVGLGCGDDAASLVGTWELLETSDPGFTFNEEVTLTFKSDQTMEVTCTEGQVSTTYTGTYEERTLQDKDVLAVVLAEDSCFFEAQDGVFIEEVTSTNLVLQGLEQDSPLITFTRI